MQKCALQMTLLKLRRRKLQRKYFQSMFLDKVPKTDTEYLEFNSLKTNKPNQTENRQKI